MRFMPSRVVPPAPAWRSALWRWRHTFLALAAAAALLAVVDAVAPVPSGEPRVALRTAVAAGTALRDGDLALVVVPDAARPARSFSAVEEVRDRRPVAALPAGTVLSEELLLGPGLAVPAGTVALPVGVADPGSRALARPGMNVTLVGGAAGEGSRALWVDVLVLSVLDPEQGMNVLGAAPSDATLVVAVPARLATVVAEASATLPLRVAVPAPPRADG